MIHIGDCIEVMRGMEADSVDAIVTDPPYGLTNRVPDEVRCSGCGWVPGGSFGKGKPGEPCTRCGAELTRTRVYRGGGFMAKEWDGTGIAFRPEVWAEMYRVAKPGAYLLSFGGTRTYHRMAVAIEDAGWIIRDTLMWIYASGFPKGKANLKPAHEPIVLARKPGPLRPLGIDAGRIGTAEETRRPFGTPSDHLGQLKNLPPGELNTGSPLGRWPSNVLLDPDSAALFDEPNPEVVGSGATSDPKPERTGLRGGTAVFGQKGIGSPEQEGRWPEDAGGGYSRFFLVPKSSRADREPVVRGGAVYCHCETVKPDRWVSEDRKPPERMGSTSRRRATSGVTMRDGSDSNTTLFGSSTSDPSPPETRSTTSTATSSTTESRTSSPSIPSPTNGSTPGASSSTASGGSDAPSAPSTDRSTPSGGTSPRKAGRSTADADPATSPESLPIRRCDDCGELKPESGRPLEAVDGVAGARRNSHPT